MKTFTVEGTITKDANGHEVFESITLPLLPIRDRDEELVTSVGKPNGHDIREHSFDTEYEEVVVENAKIYAYTDGESVVAPIYYDVETYENNNFYLIEYNDQPTLFKIVNKSKFAHHPLGGGEKVEVGFLKSDYTITIPVNEFDEYFEENVIASVVPIIK